MRMVGSKSKLNSKLTKAICKDIADGMPFRWASRNNNITEKTFYNWYNRGKKADDGIFKEFFVEVEKAKAKAVKYNVGVVMNAGKKSWQASAWWLERTCPEDFGTKKEVKADVKVEDKHMGLARLFTEEELAEMKEDLKNIDDIDEPLDDDFSEFE